MTTSRKSREVAPIERRGSTRAEQYKPDEIIVVKGVEDEPVTKQVLERCHGVPVRYAKTNGADKIKEASSLLSSTEGMASTIQAGKRVLALLSTTNAVDEFDMPDPRMGCPHFTKLTWMSNGCPYQCQWCFLRLTYRSCRPFMGLRVKYDGIKKEISKWLKEAKQPLMFNAGELQDSLALEHITGAASTFIPFFAEQPNGYLFLLTKSANVEPILGLPHKGHTVVSWSLNAPAISRQFEIGAPDIDQRLQAARKVQEDGYRLRLRLDPIVPLPGWQGIYSDVIERIFRQVTPERITLGTLRFEDTFQKMKEALIGTKSQLLTEMDKMVPMLPEMELAGGKKSVGKYSYPEKQRVEIFKFAINEIRRHFDGPIALCKETVPVWRAVGLDSGRCRCVCQFDEAALTE